jgi:hypothetical protein
MENNLPQNFMEKVKRNSQEEIGKKKKKGKTVLLHV